MPSHTIHPQGTILQGRYRIIEAVGTGGYGVVYKAEDTYRADRRVAVKSINLAGLSTQEVIEATEAFNRKVLMLSRLKHFSLPGIHDHFIDPEHWYMVMDFIEGEPLENYIMHADMSQNGTRCLPLVEVLEIGMQVADLQGHGNNVLALAWSPDSRHIATGSAFGTLVIWDVATGEQLYTYNVASVMEGINIVAWSPNGKFIVVNGDVPNSYGNDLLIFSAMTVASGPLRYYDGHIDIVTTAKWSPDSKLIASASIDATVQVWDTSKGQTKKTCTGHTSGVNAVSWSPNGQLIAFGGDDGTVQVWKP